MDEVDIFCEEAISLLAHEILCCECDSESDSESESEETGTEGEEEKDDTKDNKGKLMPSGILECGLHNPYQLMFSEEDYDHPNEIKEEKGEESWPILLDGDEQSEEKPESKGAL
ncbi:uncharacterized protein LOC128264526 isoform X2 [Drosophila gunungcola]|nr:uncharacterized protein LOC128264526 isoform X2 [Drosophila gunungcola]